MIYGNIDGIKKSALEELDSLYKAKCPKDEICSISIIETMSRVSDFIEREVSVAIDRRGNIVSVAVGDSTSVEIPTLDIREKKLAGVRIIHTHPNGMSNLSALDISALLKLKLDAIMAIGIYKGEILDCSIGMLTVFDDKLDYEEDQHIKLEDVTAVHFLNKVTYIDSLIKEKDVIEDDGERAILVGTDTKESLDELKELTKACEIPVLDMVFQNRSKIDGSFYIGRGKVLEIASLRQQLRANIVIFDDELSGSQVRNLEAAIGAKVIDRTTLILEIFARRAKSREAKIQVELAQLKYRASRLQGLGTLMSRTGGGIGTRGPGEKKLEIDRRRIREDVFELNNELKKIRKIRETQREKRNKESIPKVSLVGYTNAGKSTLRNTLCDTAAQKEVQGKEKVFEADMLFATLDITTRAIILKNKGLITLTDTVGFVRKLPHDLVEAFKSTLEEVIYSDLLCHVVDTSADTALEQIKAVEDVLEELGAKDKETLLLLNKIDKATDEQIAAVREACADYDILEISAKEGINLDILLDTIEEKLPYNMKKCQYLIPYDRSDMQSFLHRNGRVFEEEYQENGTHMIVEVDDESYNKTKDFIINIINQ